MCLKYDFRVLVPFLILLVIWMTEKLHLKDISIKAHPNDNRLEDMVGGWTPVSVYSHVTNVHLPRLDLETSP